MDPLRSPEYDYHFHHSLCRRFVQKTPGSWAQVLTKTEDDEERFDGFLYCLKSQVQRIVTSGYKTFAADVVFIKPEHNGLDGWALSQCLTKPWTSKSLRNKTAHNHTPFGRSWTVQILSYCPTEEKVRMSQRVGEHILFLSGV
jgi:hypothetical protein